MDSAKRPLPALSDVFEHAPCGLLTTTTAGIIVRVNDTFCRWTGFAADDLIDKQRFQDLLTVGGRIFHQTHWAPLLQMQRSVAEVKVDIMHRDGTIVPMLINACRRRYHDTEFDEFAILLVKDRHAYERELLKARQHAELALEAKRVAQQALQVADRRKDEFLATLAHELRNPLAPMRTVLELLRLKEFTDPQVLWSRDVLERQVGHITHLVDDLLEVSRITEGKLVLRRERLSLATAMQLAVESSRSLIDASSHKLVVTQPTPPIFLDADPTRLSQMIQNLLNNAAKYTPAGGNIWLTATRESDHVLISVRDSGIGIPNEQLPTIFEMFSQLAPALDRSQGGLGIGLSLVRALAQLHGGSVTASSAGVGLGSEFVIKLPVSASESALATAEVLPSVAQQKQRRILVIDDNEDAATSLAMLLEAEGHTACTAGDGSSGIRLAAEFEADAVILDIGLPDINGYEVAKLFRQTPSGANLLLIALTGWGQEQDKQEAKAAGFDFHFTKPVDVRRLLEALIGHTG